MGGIASLDERSEQTPHKKYLVLVGEYSVGDRCQTRRFKNELDRHYSRELHNVEVCATKIALVVGPPKMTLAIWARFQ